MVEPGVGEGAHGLDVAIRVGPAGEVRADVVLAHGRAGRGEVHRVGQFAHHLPAGKRPAGGLQRGLRGGVLVGRPGHRHLGVARPAAAVLVVLADDLGIRLGREEPVAEIGGQPRGRGSARGHRDHRGRLGQVEDAGIRQLQVLALVGPVAALPEQPDDLQRLAQHLVAHPHRVGKLQSHHMFVEAFTGADAEGEAAAGDQRGGRGGLGHDGGVVAQRRAGDAGGQADPFGARGDRAEHAPGERGMALVVEPGMEMVTDLDEVEAGLLGRHGLPDEVVRPVALGRELVSDGHRYLLSWCAVPVGRPGRRATMERLPGPPPGKQPRRGVRDGGSRCWR